MDIQSRLDFASGPTSAENEQPPHATDESTKFKRGAGDPLRTHLLLSSRCARLLEGDNGLERLGHVLHVKIKHSQSLRIAL